MEYQEIDNKPVRIDIKKIIASKNPRLSKRLPGFIIRYIERILHQDECNYLLETYKDCSSIEFNEALIREWNITIDVHHEERIPSGGRYIFAANHPLGGIESLAFIHVIHRHHPDLKFPVNDLLLNLKPFREIFVPINKHGSQAREGAVQLEEVYASDAQILFFPAGLVSRKINGRIIDLEWKKNFISKAIAHKRDIVPIHIQGRNSSFFYNLGNLRKFFGIKANIEMFFLIDEMFRYKGKSIGFTIGETIPWQTFTSEKSPSEWASAVKERVYGLTEGKY